MLQAQHWKNLEEWCEEGGDTHIETSDVEWTSDDPDPVAISRLKKSGNAQGILEERVCLTTVPYLVPDGSVCLYMKETTCFV